MKRTNMTSLALAAGCMIALAVPAAQAQSYDRSGGNPALNNAESARYDRMLETSPGFRQARMRRECGPITDPQLRQSCEASFNCGPGGPTGGNFRGAPTSERVR